MSFHGISLKGFFLITGIMNIDNDDDTQEQQYCR